MTTCISSHKWPRLAAFGLFACVLGGASAPAATADVADQPPAEQIYAEAEHHVEAKRYAEAASALEQAVEGEPDSWRAWALLGFCRVKLRRFEGAIEACSNVLKLEPGNVQAALWRAESLKGLRRYDEAIEAYQALLHTDIGRHATIECHWGLAECAQAKGESDAAKAHVKEVTRRDGRLGRILDATLRLRRGEVDDAHKRFERLFRADDEHPLILYGLATCLLEKNREQEFALRLLEQAEGAPELDPADVFIGQAQALAKLSRFEEARAVLEKVDTEVPLTDEQKKRYDEVLAAIVKVLGD